MQEQPAHGHLHVSGRLGFQKEIKNFPNTGQLHYNRLVPSLALRSSHFNGRQSF